MADFEPPSFSLGLDLDAQSEPQVSARSSLDPPHRDSFDNAGLRANSVDQLEQDEVIDSDPEAGPECTRVLKRLRRGAGPGVTNPSSSSSVKMRELERSHGRHDDDEIEDFSSQEDLLIIRGYKTVFCYFIELGFYCFFYSWFRRSSSINELCLLGNELM